MNLSFWITNCTRCTVRTSECTYSYQQTDLTKPDYYCNAVMYLFGHADSVYTNLSAYSLKVSLCRHVCNSNLQTVFLTHIHTQYFSFTILTQSGLSQQASLLELTSPLSVSIRTMLLTAVPPLLPAPPAALSPETRQKFV